MLNWVILSIFQLTSCFHQFNYHFDYLLKKRMSFLKNVWISQQQDADVAF